MMMQLASFLLQQKDGTISCSDKLCRRVEIILRNELKDKCFLICIKINTTTFKGKKSSIIFPLKSRGYKIFLKRYGEWFISLCLEKTLRKIILDVCKNFLKTIYYYSPRIADVFSFLSLAISSFNLITAFQLSLGQMSRPDTFLFLNELRDELERFLK